MIEILNVQVFGIDESIYRSGYLFLSKCADENEFNTNVHYINQARIDKKYDVPYIKRAIQLSQICEGGCDQFLTGITVTADIILPSKCWIEAEHYQFLKLVSSISTEHRIKHFFPDEESKKYVSSQIIETLKGLQGMYNNVDDNNMEDKRQSYLSLLYNLPQGFELMASVSTNYRYLKDIYIKYKNCMLNEDWKTVCQWIKTLPMAEELIVYEQ